MRYEIINQLGEKVMSAPMSGTSTRVDISSLSGGLYYLSLLSSNRIVATKKVIKQ